MIQLSSRKLGIVGIMIITFYSNFLNHHQVLIADAMYGLLGANFHFVATLPRNEKELKGGEDYSNRPYCILAGESEEAHKQAALCAGSADVCVFGACSQEFAVIRAKKNPHGLSFECGERWLKRGVLNVLSPVLRQWWLNYMHYYRKANFYKLCSSAFAAHDDELLGCYKGRHFKWGYFTEVPSEVSNFKFHDSGKSNETLSKKEEKSECAIRLMWCARFINWKHPELAIECAKRLKADGIKFELHMYGDGPMRESLMKKTESLELRDVVSFHGNVLNSEIQQAMRNSDIFLFTSDRQEGWGAVANEAMSNGCVIVGSNKIGAVPYLVKNGVTGMIFRSCDLDSLYEQVKYLLDNPNVRKQIAKAGRESMVKLWCPANAAKSLLQLIEDIQAGHETSIIEGPCSKA